MTNSGQRASIVGTGLIGGSLGLALRAQGWHVTGTDTDPEVEQRALSMQAVDAIGFDVHSDITFIAVPAGGVAAEVQRKFDAMADAGTSGVITDVAGVKASIAESVSDPRFVAGHPMAGSEQAGLDGAFGGLFEGATWVLTPTAATDDDAFALVRSVVSSLGADVVTLEPVRHDRLVAVVSHVPHLTAASLMRVASERADEHRALMRLAAGGFRDMTRIASGHPGIWPDVCAENREAIVEVLDLLIDELASMRSIIDETQSDSLVEILTAARLARVNLPGRFADPEQLSELRVPIADREGEVARVATLASELDVNLLDLEIAHSSEGNRGVLILLVETALSERLQGGLMAQGYRPSLRPLQ